MTIKHSRAQRRHDRARLKKKRRNHWGYGRQGWRSYCHDGINEMDAAQAGMVVNTPTPCSCYMCGNPRRNAWANVWEELTVQERKAVDAAWDGIEEYEDVGPYWWEAYDDYTEYAFNEDPADDWYLRWMYIK